MAIVVELKVRFSMISASRLKIGVMDGGDHLRFAEHQQVVIAFQIARPVGKAFAAEILFAQTISWIMVPHTAVQHQNTFI